MTTHTQRRTSAAPPADRHHPERDRRGRSQRPRRSGRFGTVLTHALLVASVAYFLLPIAWIVISSTKTSAGLFTSPPLGLADFRLLENLQELFAFQSGIFSRWMVNSAIYAGVGAFLSTVVCGFAGFAMAKYRFRGRSLLGAAVLGSILVPGTALTLPLYLLLSGMDLTNTYWAVLLPSLVSPLGVYLTLIYAEASIPDELLEAARMDGASELRVVLQIAAPLMIPGLITVLIFQFVAIWNNYFLPLIVLNDSALFPVTLGLKAMVGSPTTTGSLPYNLVITGALVSTIPLLILFLTLQRHWRAGLTLGSVVQ